MGQGRRGQTVPVAPSTRPNLSDSLFQASRVRTMSSCDRPMKFPHMTTSSWNGGPPGSTTRARWVDVWVRASVVSPGAE